MRFPNSIAICIQGGLEGLYQAGIFKKTNTGIMDYNVVIRKNSQDSATLENNNRKRWFKYWPYDEKIISRDDGEGKVNDSRYLD